MPNVVLTAWRSIQKLFRGQTDADVTINNALDELDKCVPWQLARDEIDVAGTGRVVLFTVPTGKRLIVTSVVLRSVDVSSLATNPTLSLGGNSTDYDDFSASASRDLDGIAKLKLVSPPATWVSYAANIEFSVKITGAAPGLVIGVDVFGYTVDA